MEPKPYWEFPDVEKVGLTECILFCPLQHMEKILEVKRCVASKACSQVLKRDADAEIVALLGSVARGDITGWFSDIDMLVVTGKPREEEMVVVDHHVLFIEYHDWASLEELVVRRIAWDEYEVRSSYLSFYGSPYYLHGPEKSRARYEEIMKLGVEALWRDHSQTDEYLDDFVYFYGAAVEALRYDQPLTAIGKLHRGAILLLRYYLIKNRILLRKPLPDERTMIKLRHSQVPTELVDFLEQMYRGRLSIDALLQRGKEVYLQVLKGRKWLNKIPM